MARPKAAEQRRPHNLRLTDGVWDAVLMEAAQRGVPPNEVMEAAIAAAVTPTPARDGLSGESREALHTEAARRQIGVDALVVLALDTLRRPASLVPVVPDGPLISVPYPQPRPVPMPPMERPAGTIPWTVRQGPYWKETQARGIRATVTPADAARPVGRPVWDSLLNTGSLHDPVMGGVAVRRVAQPKPTRGRGRSGTALPEIDGDIVDVESQDLDADESSSLAVVHEVPAKAMGRTIDGR